MIRITLAFLIMQATVAWAGDLRAGAFAINVTPKKFPISVNGNFADIQATAANDPIHARCLVLDDGQTKLAIVIVGCRLRFRASVARMSSS